MTPSRRFLSTLVLLSGGALAATVPSALVGEWFVGPQYPASVYTSAFGGAGSDARRLVLNPDGTFVFTEFDSTYLSSSFGTTGYPITCQMMSVLVERGTFAVKGPSITFNTTRTERNAGYSPDRLNNGCKRHAGSLTPKTVSGANTVAWTIDTSKLTLKADGGAVTYVRRAPPVPTTAAAAPTPSAPPRATEAPPPAPRATPPAAPAKWTATGAWDAVITVNGRAFRVRLNLQDDSPRILGYGDDPVKYANGNSESGALDVGLEVEGQTMELKVSGRFDGDRYDGDARWTNYEGDDLGRGTLTMTRRP